MERLASDPARGHHESPSHMKLSLEPCIAPLWASSGHAQTVWGHLLPSAKLRGKRTKIIVPLEDGDRLIGHFIEGKSDTAVSLFHGLSGNAEADYIQRTAQV